MVQQGNKGRAAGCRHLPALLLCLDPLLRLVSGRHVAAEAHFHHIRKTGFHERGSHGRHADFLPELALRRRCAHGDHALPALHGLNHVHEVRLGADGTEGAVVNAVAAVHALLVVNHAQAVLIIMNGSDGAGLAAGSLQMDDGPEGAGLGAHPAGLAFSRIDAHLCVAGGDGLKAACIETRPAQTEAASVRDRIFLNRAVVAGCRDHGHHIFGRLVDIRALSHGEPDPAAYNLPLLIDAAPVLGLGARAHLICDLLAVIVRQFVIPRQAAHLADDEMLQVNNPLVICNHRSLLIRCLFFSSRNPFSSSSFQN